MTDLLTRGWMPRKDDSETWAFYCERRRLEVCGEVLRQEAMQRDVARQIGSQLVRREPPPAPPRRQQPKKKRRKAKR